MYVPLAVAALFLFQVVGSEMSYTIAREGDSVFLEVHRDIYGRAPEPMAIIRERARTGGYLDMLDLTRVEEVSESRTESCGTLRHADR